MQKGFTLVQLLVSGSVIAYLLMWMATAIAGQSRQMLSAQRETLARQEMARTLQSIEAAIRRRAAPNFLSLNLIPTLSAQFPDIDFTTDYPNAVFQTPSSAFSGSCSDLVILQTDPASLQIRPTRYSTRCVANSFNHKVLNGVPHHELACPPGTLPALQNKNSNTLALSACFRMAYAPSPSAPPARIPVKLDVEVHALYQSGPQSVSWVHDSLLLDLQLLSRNGEYLPPN